MNFRHLCKVLNRACFKINLFGNLKPLHINSPLCNLLSVYKVLCSNVFRNRVLTVRTTTKCKGRSHGVVYITDSAKGSRRVDNNTACLHYFTVSFNNTIVRRVNNSCVTCTVNEHSFTHFKCFLAVLCFYNRKNRGELFKSERVLFGVCVRNFNAEYLGFLRNCNAGLFRNLPRILTNNPRLNSHLLYVNYNILNFLNFFRLSKVTAVIFHKADCFIINLIINDCSLLGSTNHTIVKGLGKDKVVNSLLEISGLFNIARCVTWANAESRLTCGVSSLNHTRATCCKDCSNIRVVHEQTCSFNGRIFNPLYTVFRSTSLDSSITNNHSSLLGAFLCRWMETENDRISCLSADNGLEHCCGSRVGCRCNTANDTNRLSNFHIAFINVVLNNANSLFVLDGVPDIFSREDVLCNLILENTSACFFNSHLCKFHLCGKTCKSHRLSNLVNLFLVEFHVFFKSNFCVCNEGVDHSSSVNFGFFCNGSLLFLCHN